MKPSDAITENEKSWILEQGGFTLKLIYCSREKLIRELILTQGSPAVPQLWLDRNGFRTVQDGPLLPDSINYVQLIKLFDLDLDMLQGLLKRLGN